MGEIYVQEICFKRTMNLETSRNFLYLTFGYSQNSAVGPVHRAGHWKQKSHGGVKGYNTSVGMIDKWCNIIVSNFESMISVKKTDTSPKDLSKSQMKFAISGISIVAMMLSCGNPFS